MKPVLYKGNQSETAQILVERLYFLTDLVHQVSAHPDQWRPLVLTNGCFDLLHAGHVRYLAAARALGKTLVVGLNSDHSVQAIKPAVPGRVPRPLVPQAQRAEVLAAVRSVDAVVIFEEPTAAELVVHLKPDLYAKGGDYTIDSLPEAPLVSAYGGRVVLVQVEIPTSTTAIINRIEQHTARG